MPARLRLLAAPPSNCVNACRPPSHCPPTALPHMQVHAARPSRGHRRRPRRRAPRFGRHPGGRRQPRRLLDVRAASHQQGGGLWWCRTLLVPLQCRRGAAGSIQQCLATPRCHVPCRANAAVHLHTRRWQGWAMRPGYRFVYTAAATSQDSKFFDAVAKVSCCCAG